MSIQRRGLLALALSSMAAPVFIPRQRIHVAPIIGLDLATDPDQTAFVLHDNFKRARPDDLLPVDTWVRITDDNRRQIVAYMQFMGAKPKDESEAILRLGVPPEALRGHGDLLSVELFDSPKQEFMKVPGAPWRKA